MIKTREQRKTTTLLKRRIIAIVVCSVIALVFIVSSIVLYNYFSDNYVFTDVDEARTEYAIKRVNGVFVMMDKNGEILKKEKALDSNTEYYVTDFGTTIKLDETTGEYTVKYLPAVNFLEDGEFIDHELLTVFKGVESANIRSIEVRNENGEYTIWRYDFSALKQSDTASFVLKDSPVSALNKDKLSYLVYYAGHPLVNSRLDDPIKDANGLYTEYGLAEKEMTDAQGNKYTYKPITYKITTTSGDTHTIVIGHKLIDGSGYYLQYINGSGVARDAVYIFNPTDMSDLNGANFENTLLASAATLIDPYLLYPSTTNDYFDVTNFTISQKNKDGTAYDQIVGFSYVDMDNRKDTAQSIHPYVFLDTSFYNYHPNYDNIDTTLMKLMDPQIVKVAVLSPKNEDRYNYGLMKKTELEDGSIKYEYDAEYVVSFDKVITDEVSGEKQKITQTLYISKANEDGNYYTYATIRFTDAPDDAVIKGVSLDSICEVSPETMMFLQWDPYDWVYTGYMEISISYANKIELISKDYSASFDIKSYKEGDLNIMEIEASYTEGSKTESIKTFGLLKFTDAEGYQWIVTPARIYMYGADGKEYKPSTRRFEYNSIGEQVHVIDKYANTRNGDHIYVDKDYVTVQHANGTTEKYLRYHNTIFKKFFGSVTGTSIVDSYIISNEEEQTLISNPDNHLLTVKITDKDNTVFTYNFYNLTARKSYITVSIQKQGETESSTPTGGFYVQATRVKKMVSDAKKFFAGEDVDYEAHK